MIIKTREQLEIIALTYNATYNAIISRLTTRRVCDCYFNVCTRRKPLKGAAITETFQHTQSPDKCRGLKMTVRRRVSARLPVIAPRANLTMCDFRRRLANGRLISSSRASRVICHSDSRWAPLFSRVVPGSSGIAGHSRVKRKKRGLEK